MTSEVLILNKRAVVLGADSAVTTSGGEHPRYSKSANKIFELSKKGSVAAAIYSNASIDFVPWELVLKMFRNQLGGGTFPRLMEYSSALLAYLNKNDVLFPKNLRDETAQRHFDDAVRDILKETKRKVPEIFDEKVSLDDRKALWKKEVDRLNTMLDKRGIIESLSQSKLDELIQNIDVWENRVLDQIGKIQWLAAVDAAELAKLGHKMRYVLPDYFSGSTGVVVAGYGDDQIFPAYEHVEIFGHVGDELAYRAVKSFEVTHSGIAMIQPLAQTSMIDMFTDGFGTSLESIIENQSDIAFLKIFEDLKDQGVVVDDKMVKSIADKCHADFMLAWKRENWKRNFSPLVSVLQTLSVQEMAHLAESLLGLESLKERVTSPSESVGGPIDVAAITKGEGLVWIRRKHYFDANLNMRYAARLERSID